MQALKTAYVCNKEVSFDQLGLFAEDTWALTDSLASDFRSTF